MSSSENSSNSDKILKLQSSDNHVFEVEVSVAMQSQILKNLVEDGCADNVVPITNVDAKTLAKIIDWCVKHTKPNIEEEKKLKEWNNKFVDVDQEELYSLLMASNYLNIKGLFDQLCEKVASMIRGKTPEQIRETFNIKNDFTPEEEEEIKRENSWAFD